MIVKSELKLRERPIEARDLMQETPLKISIVTAVFNRSRTVANAIESVLAQDYPHIEYIVVDGMSTDGTDEIVRRYSDRIAVSIREPDSGIYDALNKGVQAATGDVLGFLHADDFLASDGVISEIARCMVDPGLSGTYGDLVYVDAIDTAKTKRYWVSGRYDAARFRWGWMPPHPTVYLRRECYRDFGLFRRDFQIAADYELLVRMMVRHRISMRYIDRVVVKMREGGKSNASMQNRLTANREDRKAWVVNGMQPPVGLRFSKPLRKLVQYVRRPVG